MKVIKQKVELLNNLFYEQMVQNVVSASNQCWKTGCLFDGTLAEGEKIIKARIKVGHESLIEHAYLTMKFTTNRAITHEIVRHRLASYTQASTRYQNYTKEAWGGLTMIQPHWITENICGEWSEEKYDSRVEQEGTTPTSLWLWGRLSDEWEYKVMAENDMTPDDMRGILPNDLATTLVMTANMRQWRHFFKLRALSTTGRAHPQIVELATTAMNMAHDYAPCFFEDLKDNWDE